MVRRSKAFLATIEFTLIVQKRGPSADDFRRKNRRGLLKSYYGDNKEEQKSNRIDPLDVGMLAI
jgi:hypothetical protein